MIFVKRRAAVWSPLDLGNVGGWWDASDTSSITASSGATSQWNDKSGNGYHFTQSTGSAQPTTGTRTQNSLNVLDFDGGDWMTAGDVLDVTTGGLTLFVVCKFDGTGDGTPVGKHVNGAGHGRYGLTRVSGSMYAIFADPGGDPGPTKADTSTAARVLSLRVARSGGNKQLFFDGTSQVTQATSGASSYNTTQAFKCGEYDGSLYRLDGWIGEIIHYTTNLSDTDHGTVVTNLKTKWGTA